MQNPFHVAFKGMDANKDVEKEVRAWVVKLKSLTDAAGMLSGRVTVESVAWISGQRHAATRYCAYVEMSTLDQDVIVGRDQDGNAAHDDVYVAVRNAFRLLRRQLIEHGERRTLERARDDAARDLSVFPTAPLVSS